MELFHSPLFHYNPSLFIDSCHTTTNWSGEIVHNSILVSGCQMKMIRLST